MTDNGLHIDDLHRVTINYMNVWQTIELLAGNDIRRRYTPYEGYHDTHDILKSFRPAVCQRRDSFSAQNPVQSAPDENVTTNAFGSARDNDGTRKCRIALTASKRSMEKGKKSKRRRKRRNSKDGDSDKLPAEYGDLVDCSYSLPRISTRLERLMGTNVIRLTDRKYMTELRLRIAQDYQVQLAKRIDGRECKEIERERNLILDGKTNVIPEGLAEHPIFIVNKQVNEIIALRRSKLKTNREKNAERLQRQGIKWERERIFFEAAEKEKEIKWRLRQQELAGLQQKFAQEDAINKLELLRIRDDSWQESEMQLKDFLEQQRNKMKARSRRVPTPFIKDRDDIVYKIRERIRREEIRLEQIRLEEEERLKNEEQEKIETINKRGTQPVKGVQHKDKNIKEIEKPDTKEAKDAKDAKQKRSTRTKKDDKVEFEIASSEMFFAEIDAQLEEDVIKGLLMSREQYASMYYTDPKVAKLKLTTTIRELYRLAEEIIIGALEELDEEEGGIEEEEEEEEELDDALAEPDVELDEVDDEE